MRNYVVELIYLTLFNRAANNSEMCDDQGSSHTTQSTTDSVAEDSVEGPTAAVEAEADAAEVCFCASNVNGELY